MVDMVEVDTRPLAVELERMLNRSYNPLSINMQVAQILGRMVDNKFEDEGPGWQELSETTLRLRRAGGEGARILQDTGVLVNSITTEAGVEDAEVYTNNPYAKFHVSDEPRDMIPKRDFFDIDIDSALAQATQIILEDIGRGR